MGGVILAWEDARDYFTSGWDIYAVRLTGTGTVAPGWPPNGVAVCRAPENQYYPQLVPDGTGGAIITWQDYRDGDSFNDVGGAIYSVRLDGFGQVGKGWTTDGTRLCAGAASQFWPRIVGDDAGGAIIVWNDDDIHAQRLTHDGQVAAGWPACGVTLCGASGRQEYAATCSDGASGGFVVWRDLRNYFPPGSAFPAYDLFGTHVTASGGIPAGWPVNGLALSDAPDGQFNASVTPDGSGGAVTAWEDYRSGEGRIYALRVTAVGTLAPGWPVNGASVSTAAGFQFSPVLAPDPTGGAFIAFMEIDPATSFSWVRVQRVTAGGQTALGVKSKHVVHSGPSAG